VIWVVATSKHGSTAEVADALAEELRRAGHDVERKDADQVHGFVGADAVALGSPIYGGRWLEAGRRLLSDQAEALSARPVWVFSVGPLGDPPKPDEPEPQALVQSATEIGAREHRSVQRAAGPLRARARRATDGSGGPRARRGLSRLGGDPGMARSIADALG
jgi:menaquinone-dependent protoporphyrinogen oxidase